MVAPAMATGASLDTEELMGSVVKFRCPACSFSTEELRVGWGKAGRATFWGGLARCDGCQEMSVADLSRRRATREEPRCGHCNAVLALIEGTLVSSPCPRCRKPLEHENVGTWS